MSSYLSPSSSHSHVLRLIQTTRSARLASVQALHMQYQRMSETERPNMPDPHQPIPGAFPSPPDHKHRHDSVTRRPESRNRQGSRCNSPVKNPEEIRIQPYPNPPSNPSLPQEPRDRRGDHCKSPANKPEEITIQPYPNPRPKPSPSHQPNNNKLFCVYARDLQKHLHLPLTDNYKAGGDNMCPYCHAHTSIRPGKAWEILADSCKKGDHKRHRFLIKNRFVIKCHREGAGFACVLCARFKESDTVCRRVEALMEHLWKDHTSEELEKDDDVFEIDE
jgi:hypothetical protein